ncbi:MAG TPA: hypothetical protein VF510_09940, partial [Ktedonobacterales bacterium]
MPPGQNPPNTDGAPRPDQDDVNWRPMLWIYGTGITVLLTSIIILSQGDRLSSISDMLLLFKAGMVLIGLSFLFLMMPGVLAAMRHPWGAAYLLAAERRYVHPRLYGLAEGWASFVLSVSAALLFVQDPFSTPYSYWLDRLLTWGAAALAVFLVTIAPMLAFYLF